MNQGAKNFVFKSLDYYKIFIQRRYESKYIVTFEIRAENDESRSVNMRFWFETSVRCCFHSTVRVPFVNKIWWQNIY